MYTMLLSTITNPSLSPACEYKCSGHPIVLLIVKEKWTMVRTHRCVVTIFKLAGCFILDAGQRQERFVMHTRTSPPSPVHIQLTQYVFIFCQNSLL